MKLRKIALCVDLWWSEENFFAWNFARKRFLQDEESMNSTDHIYIVHVNAKGKEGDTWDRGTPVLGDVQSELATYEHSIVELEGDPVTSIVDFIAEEGIHVTILSLKDQNRVTRRMLPDSTLQILTKAQCACIIVTPRFSAGDHFRMQAKRQPDALVANSVRQYRRRVLILLNTGVWDSALTQYAATNITLSGDLVILVRCVNDHNYKKNAEYFQTERDNMRELGWHKFRNCNVSLAVEVIKNTNRCLCEFIESKGIDLVVMARPDPSKLKIPIKKENAFSHTFHDKCPCPYLLVSSEILRSFSTVAPHDFQRHSSHKRSGSCPRSPLLESLRRFRKHTHFSRFSAFSHSHFKRFSLNRRCLSMDSSEKNPELDSLGYFCSTRLNFVPPPSPGQGMEMTAFNVPWAQNEAEESMIASASQSLVNENIFNHKDEEVRVLKQELSEKEKEIRHLKRCIDDLQKS